MQIGAEIMKKIFFVFFVLFTTNAFATYNPNDLDIIRDINRQQSKQNLSEYQHDNDYGYQYWRSNKEPKRGTVMKGDAVPKEKSKSKEKKNDKR